MEQYQAARPAHASTMLHCRQPQEPIAPDRAAGTQSHEHRDACARLQLVLSIDHDLFIGPEAGSISACRR